MVEKAIACTRWLLKHANQVLPVPDTDFLELETDKEILAELFYIGILVRGRDSDVMRRTRIDL